jgi:hypothetical protein
VEERVSKRLDGEGGESYACVFKKLSTIIRVHDHTWVLHSDAQIALTLAFSDLCPRLGSEKSL